MASTASSSGASSSGSGFSKGDKLDPITRNALRYTISPKEYGLLHQYLLSRAPPTVRKRVPRPPNYEAIVKSMDDYNAAAVRAALRVFGVTIGGLKLFQFIMGRVMSRRGITVPYATLPFWKNTGVRLSSALALLLLFHRLLHRFFLRLRASLLLPSSDAFRSRNPGVSSLLTSRLAAPIGASLAGGFLALYPAAQLRITAAIYVFSRSLEYIYNALDEEGYLANKPWWFGSWLLMPLSFGQLLHSFVFERDCMPPAFANFARNYGGPYIQARPSASDYPASAPWPETDEIVDGLAEISNLKWPAFISPTLFPNNPNPLPSTLSKISPITSPAHPALQHLSCALVHPSDPSCLRTYIHYFLSVFPRVTRFFAIIYGALSLFRLKAILANPGTALNGLAKSILRISLMITGALGTSWGSICLFNNILPGKAIPELRWFLGGALGGLWGFVEHGNPNARGNFMYTTRSSLDSLWKVGVKRRWWKGVANGDVILFIASLAAINAVHEIRPSAVRGPAIRKAISSLSGEGWTDRCATKADTKGKGPETASQDGKDDKSMSDVRRSVTGGSETLGESTVVVDRE
ncbi:hypothetical protein P152DRAFT_435473 [Eremomyces bilateralis CBS 781.70]|uniref:Transmembrane protein 135 N-terminal domain-containing protein n=1 Tax=Eremomyces bilateralis CBS 781.70 TaxID=1392243 RepID=A0A6G1G4R2_9PEZI|nr:uncharacterized protein P152DRAFT_435473 [Eremomyces bilateralis CBS 781.70]KAF1813053.1 hypothetical protein P152DRAFT_435473 [Eremomyces bilateralis CBS 781.70]